MSYSGLLCYLEYSQLCIVLTHTTAGSCTDQWKYGYAHRWQYHRKHTPLVCTLPDLETMLSTRTDLLKQPSTNSKPILTLHVIGVGSIESWHIQLNGEALTQDYYM